MEITGIILKKSEITTYSERFSVQEIYLDCSTFNQFTGNKIENILKFQFSNNKIQKIVNLQKGDRIKIQFMPQGRIIEKDNGEKFHVMNLNAWDVSIINRNGAYTLPAGTESENSNVKPIDVEDLPF